MSPLRNRVKLIHKDLDVAIKEVLSKYGLKIKSSNVRYDDLTLNLNLKTFFSEKKGQLDKIENDLGQAMNGLNFKIGDIIKQSQTPNRFEITGFKDNGTILAVVCGVDPKSTIRRYRITKRFFASLEKIS